MTNLLHAETSPYLLQHKDNPVHWQPWGDEALTQAREENKPILLSVGYAACHWCHVMAHECFENDSIAKLMNDHFINIKVDREERPDIDSIYQTALAMMGEQGGWPLTIFLTPEGYPFWGGTYFPPEAKWGRAGFPDILQAISKTHQEEPDKILSNVEALKAGLTQLSDHQPGTDIQFEDLDRVTYGILPHLDPVNGGLQGAPKFPQPSLLRHLWYEWKRTGDAKIQEPLLLTLRRISQGGIYDHLAGGFARYAVDEAWLVPHFEKMLYDNAQLIELLALAWQQERDPLFAIRVSETVEFLIRDMQEEEGGFASSFDADSEGEEGLFYVWDESEIDELLGDESSFFKSKYGVTAGGNFEGRTILNRLAAENMQLNQAEEIRLAPMRAKLLMTREKRIWPGKDDKVLTDWNGMTIRALALAARIFNRPDWLEAAQKAYQLILTNMTKDGRLLHSWREGQARHRAILDDYVQMMGAALALNQSSPDPLYIQQVESWFQILEDHYHEGTGGYFLTADEASDLITRTRSAQDQATPSGNGQMVEILTQLYCLTGKTLYRERAEDQIRAFSAGLDQRSIGLTSLLTGAAFSLKPLQIVIAGEKGDEGAKRLLDCLSGISLPIHSLDLVTADSPLPQDHPAHGKGPVDGQAAAYICVGPVCSLPLTDEEALEKHLSELK